MAESAENMYYRAARRGRSQPESGAAGNNPNALTWDEPQAQIAQSVKDGSVRTSEDLLNLLSVKYANETPDGYVEGASDYRIAKLLGVSTSTVSKWRLGKSGMSDVHVLKAADHLGISPLYVHLIVAGERTRSVGLGFVIAEALKEMEKTRQAITKSASVYIILLGLGLMSAGAAALDVQGGGFLLTLYTLYA